MTVAEDLAGRRVALAPVATGLRQAAIDAAKPVLRFPALTAGQRAATTPTETRLMNNQIARRARLRSPLAAAGFALAAVALASPLLAQSSSPTGTVERIKVDSPAIAGNLQGNTADRDVLVYLPPSYLSSPRRRYPVIRLSAKRPTTQL